MTTPSAPSEPIYAPLGGTGTLGTTGTNVLQGSVDRLDTSVTSLTDAVRNLTESIQSMSGMGSGSLGGRATRQQGAGVGQGFPSMINPFQSSSQQLGIGGGGPGGYGNVSRPNTFRSQSFLGTAAGAMLGFGASNQMNLINLNQYATSSMIGANINGMSRGQAMQMMYQQAGMGGNGYNNLALSQADSLNSMAILQQRAGSQFVGRTAIGRATLGAQSAFGVMNPTLGATGSANIASALYSQAFSMNAMTLGYRPILSQRVGGAPMNQAQAAMSILNTMGLGKMNAGQVYGNLMSGKGQSNLSALFGSSGISNQAAAEWLTGIATLSNNDKMSSSQINSLLTQAASGTPSVAKAAQAKLSQLGIATANNDISALKGNQAIVANRMGSYAGGFNQGLQDATGLLGRFNSILSTIVNGPAGTALGYGGGLGSTLAGASNGVGLLTSAATLRAVSRLGSSAGAGAAMDSAAGMEGAGLAGASGAALFAPVAAAAAPILGAMIVGKTMTYVEQKLLGKSYSSYQSQGQQIVSGAHSLGAPNLPFVSGPLGTFSAWLSGVITGHPATQGGGASPVSSSSTSQSRGPAGSMTGNVSGSARRAVGAAESQLGVPYIYGDEIPGVGFDCSALMQWAYKQAGVSLPRTAAQQWNALKGRAVPLGSVQEGDLVFAAGADGSATSPGHVGMMIAGNKLIQAPHTGANVEITGYNPSQWSHAARPSGSGSFIAGQVASSVSGNSNSLFPGNRGAAGGIGGTYGSVSEVDIISGMGGMSGRGPSNGSSGSPNTVTSGGSSNLNVSTAGGGNTAQNKALAMKMAAAMYNWTGVQWTQGLLPLWMGESGFNQYAFNNGPNTKAYGIAQFEPATWATVGGSRTSNPGLQIKYGLEYIKKNYGSPVGAYQKWSQRSPHWYGAGGTTLPGLSIVGDRGPELMMSGGGDRVFSNSQTMQLISAIRGSAPAQSPWKTDVTSGGSTASSNTSHNLSVTFSQGSISFNGSGTSKSDAINAGREVTRQIVKHLSDEAVHAAIRRGEKL